MSISAGRKPEKDTQDLIQKKLDNLYVEGFTGNDWGDKITFTVGATYFAACCFGFVRGSIEAFPRNWNMPKKLLLNNFFNSVGRKTAGYGNACAAASLMYCFIGSSLNFFFEDELAELSQLQKNVLCGALTGGLYKSTLGLRPFIVGSVLGAGITFTLHNTIAYLNEKNYISFEMKY